MKIDKDFRGPLFLGALVALIAFLCFEEMVPSILMAILGFVVGFSMGALGVMMNNKW